MILALAEMCILGNIGAKIKIPNKNISSHEYLFGEDQSRYLIEIKENLKNEVFSILSKNSIYYEVIGITQKDNLDFEEEFSIKVEKLKEMNSSWFKNFYEEN